ncbi:ubiquitin thioesterase otulin isoform X4 [Trachemys scripta elegans]|uniref:ubiquitin thioesterase otulin isoform X4 n=1 Tax=Trachemys scripta elegans TaxID=31138 RepID=UPI001554F72E|nr:ubiquitin thioesterase otulin isoform X4 [Trachemys scripta elegans]
MENQIRNMGNTWTSRHGCQRMSNPEVANGEQKTMLKQRTRSNSCSNQEVPQESDLQSFKEEANRGIQEKQDGNISEDSDKLSQGMFQRKTSKSTGPSASAEETQKKDTAMINLTRHEKEKYIPSDELSLASATGDQKEKPALETKKECAHSGHGKTTQAHDLKASLTSHDSHKNCEVKLSASSSSSAKESSVDNEEDMYRDAEEIEREKVLPVCETGSSENKLSVAPEMDIIEYCQKEWRGNTPAAKRMKKGYEAVSQKFTSIRRVRGDNYCALRATLFQALSQTSELPDWLQSEDLTLLPEKLLSKYDWIQQWQLRQKLGRKMGELSDEIKDYLILLRKKVEMFLLAYALQYTIRVYRLYKYSTDEFITLYPNDPEEDWPVVTLITEDDRHYNIPVRMCEETSL